jgi:diacylglycerol kinase (ATP)
MRRVLLITNPMAARTDQKVVHTVSSVLRREGWSVEVVGINRPGHAADLARAAVDDGIETIAVYGGDGTTMQVVSAVIGKDVVLGLIPGGTGNLLAGNLRLPRNPERAAMVVARGKPRAIDLGRMLRADETHYFAVACGAGFDAELMAGTTSSAKRRWKMGAYVAKGWKMLHRLENVPYRITVDGETFEGDAATVMVANCAEFIPPFIRFRDGISLDDGMFEVVILRATGLLESVGVLWHLLRAGGRPGPNVQYARGSTVTVETDPPRPVLMDGEPAGVTPFTAELLPLALRVLVRDEP